MFTYPLAKLLVKFVHYSIWIVLPSYIIRPVIRFVENDEVILLNVLMAHSNIEENVVSPGLGRILWVFGHSKCCSECYFTLTTNISPLLFETLEKSVLLLYISLLTQVFIWRISYFCLFSFLFWLVDFLSAVALPLFFCFHGSPSSFLRQFHTQ